MNQWTLTVGIDKFTLTDKEKDFYMTQVIQGVKYIQIRPTLIVGTNFQSLTCENTGNPILQDPKYQQYLEVKTKDDDVSFRQRMVLETYLSTTYPMNKFSKEWGEINTRTTAITR